MYLEHFGLHEAPFRITPNIGFWYSGAQREELLEALLYALAHGEGLIKVTGEVGSGKTMLLRMLQSRLPEGVELLYLVNPALDPNEILHALLADMGEPAPAESHRQALLQRLNEGLMARHAAGRRVAVAVEEAQAMSLESLEFLRLLTNLETSTDKLLQVVLFGQPELDGLLATPRIRQLKDRITLSLALPAMPEAEVGAYLEARLQRAGYRGPSLFPPRVVQAIARASKGLVRRINILADKTLLAAYGEGTRNLKPAHVRAALADAEFATVPPRKTAIPWLWALAGLGAAAALAAFVSWQGQGAPATTPAPRQALSAPAPVANTPEALALATDAWLARSPPAVCTLQLRTIKDAREAAVLLNDMEKLDVPRPLRLFHGRTPSGPAWMILAGEFSRREAAEAALAGLSLSLRAYQPFVRSVGKMRLAQLPQANGERP